MKNEQRKKNQESQSTYLLLTVKQVADRLQYGTNRVYVLIASGVIPSVKIGKTIRVPVAALERWIEEETSA